MTGGIWSVLGGIPRDTGRLEGLGFFLVSFLSQDIFLSKRDEESSHQVEQSVKLQHLVAGRQDLGLSAASFSPAPRLKFEPAVRCSQDFHFACPFSLSMTRLRQSDQLPHPSSPSVNLNSFAQICKPTFGVQCQTSSCRLVLNHVRERWEALEGFTSSDLHHSTELVGSLRGMGVRSHAMEVVIPHDLVYTVWNKKRRPFCSLQPPLHR